MMQGDPRVDELMRPVLAAIRRHVKNGDAVTDIYNRAYEAVMEVQDALNGSAAVTAKQISENAKNLQRAERLQAALDAAINMNIEKTAEIINLRAALAAANEDAERLASSLENEAYPFPIRRSIDEKDAALRAHRARVGGGDPGETHCHRRTGAGGVERGSAENERR